MGKVPTAEEYIKQYPYVDSFLSSAQGYDVLKTFMIEFAKLHVTAALKEAIECAPTSSTDPIHHSDVLECLKDCYSLDKIK